MKLKIKVKYLNDNVVPLKSHSKGDWIDLSYNGEGEIRLNGPYAVPKTAGREKRDVLWNGCKIPLGVAMQLPAGFEAIVASRSSTFWDYHIVETNGIGVIDHTYCGNHDEWKMPVIAFRDTVIPEHTRICQFRIQLSQKAKWWQKLMWLFTDGIEFVRVKDLTAPDRGGFGSTNK